MIHNKDMEKELHIKYFSLIAFSFSFYYKRFKYKVIHSKLPIKAKNLTLKRLNTLILLVKTKLHGQTDKIFTS